MEKVRKYSFIFVITILVIIVVSISFLFKQMDSKLRSIEITNNEIKIVNETYKFEEIVDVELLDEVSLLGGSGSNTPNTNNGYYKVNGEKFKSRVCIYKNIRPYIRMKVKDSVIVFNKDSADETYQIYNKLIALKK